MVCIPCTFHSLRQGYQIEQRTAIEKHHGLRIDIVSCYSHHPHNYARRAKTFRGISGFVLSSPTVGNATPALFYTIVSFPSSNLKLASRTASTTSIKDASRVSMSNRPRVDNEHARTHFQLRILEAAEKGLRVNTEGRLAARRARLTCTTSHLHGTTSCPRLSVSPANDRENTRKAYTHRFE